MLHCVGMRLAPGIFMRANVGRFAKIGGSRILPWDQITRLNQDPVRHAVMDVAAVIVGSSTERNPVKGLTQAREPMLFWSPFSPET